jgi:hypothetical protein
MALENPPAIDPPPIAGIPDVLDKLNQVLNKLDTILGNMDVPDDEPHQGSAT